MVAKVEAIQIGPAIWKTISVLYAWKPLIKISNPSLDPSAINTFEGVSTTEALQNRPDSHYRQLPSPSRGIITTTAEGVILIISHNYQPLYSDRYLFF